MFFKRKRPQEVFTPRAAEINENMYVTRPELERRLKRAIQGSYHVIVYGDSGSGKSWLYQKVLQEIGAHYIPINLAFAKIHKSITSQFKLVLDGRGTATKTAYTETKMAEANAVVAKGQLAHTGTYIIGQKEPFEECLAYLRSEAGGAEACIVFDNLEAIFEDSNLMDELGNLIILLDDPRIAQYRVKFLIVGVPADIKEYFSKAKNLQTIANRLEEIPEVARLSREQVEHFVSNGFKKQLKIKISTELLQEYGGYIHWITMGIPQRLHEFCLEVAYLCEENNWKAEQKFLAQAELEWMKQSLNSKYVVVEGLMNAIKTNIGRRNQVLFALGRCELIEFKPMDIEEIVKREFTKTTNVTMNIGQILAEIAGKDNSPIKKSAKGDGYVFTDPKYCICLRAMLKKDNNENIEKIPIESV